MTRWFAPVLAVGVATVLCSAASGAHLAKPKPKKKPVPYMTKLVAAAKKEGTVSWYSAIPLATDQTIAAAFTKRYGIKVEIFNVSTGPLEDKYASERQSGVINADVINVADPIFMNDGASNKHWFTLGLKPANMPSLAKLPKKYFHANAYANIGIQPIGIAYNKNLVSKPPTTWSDLLDPAYRGHVLLTDPTLVPAWQAVFKLWADTGQPTLASLAATKPKFVSSSNPGAQQVAAGETWINAPTSLTALTALQSQGAPIGFVIPPVTTGVEMLMALSNPNKHPYAARLFMNWILSPEGQAVVNAGTAAAVLPNIPGTLKLPSGYRTPDMAGAQRALGSLLAPFGR
jgi:ABC-type Fe3+ transport system substrate-binding protein